MGSQSVLPNYVYSNSFLFFWSSTSDEGSTHRGKMCLKTKAAGGNVERWFSYLEQNSTTGHLAWVRGKEVANGPRWAQREWQQLFITRLFI